MQKPGNPTDPLCCKLNATHQFIMTTPLGLDINKATPPFWVQVSSLCRGAVEAEVAGEEEGGGWVGSRQDLEDPVSAQAADIPPLM